MSVPVHPEAVPGRPEELRWVVPAGTLDFVGEPRALPAALQALVADGTLRRVEVEPDAVRLEVGTGRTWAGEGARVRTALLAALEQTDAWTPPAGASSDDVLRRAVEQVVAGDVGDYVRGHGGRIEVLAVRDGRVEVSLGGACAHCPASDVTLTDRFEEAVRARCPEVREVVAVSAGAGAGSGMAGGRRLLDLFPRRA